MTVRVSVPAGLAALAIAAVLPLAPGFADDDHVVLEAEEIEWTSGPASLPEGAEMAVLYGDPGKDGLFAMRLKLPDGFHIAPHTHPREEIVTVISGTFRIGMGTSADADAATALGAGGFFGFPPDMVHYAYAEGETVVQLNSTGPWAVNYVNPEDDPRQQAQN